jgi:hypothetical protein
MSQGSVSFASHRSGSRFNGIVRDPLFSRCVLRVPPDCDVHSAPTRNLVHYFVRRVLLSNDALWAKKCGRYFPTMHVTCLRGVDRSHHRSLRRRHRSQVEENRGPGPRPHRGLRKAAIARGEAEPREVRFRGYEGHAFRLCRVRTRHRS